MPKFDFECKSCGNIEEIYCKFEEIKDLEKELSCYCGGKFKKIFSSKVNIIGTNRFIQKPGLDPEQSKERARKSLEKRKTMKLNPGGIL